MEEEEKEDQERNHGINETVEIFLTKSSEFSPRLFHVGFMVEIEYCVSPHSATFHLINIFYFSTTNFEWSKQFKASLDKHLKTKTFLSYL
jgi:hypothetical protein